MPSAYRTSVGGVPDGRRRIDVDRVDEPSLLRLLDIGALDVEVRDDGGGAAILPDGGPRDEAMRALSACPT